MNTNNYIKGYAVIKSRCIENDVLSAYLPFVATIIVEEKMNDVDEEKIKLRIKEKYDMDLCPSFIRQVLSHAMKKGAITKIREQYIVNQREIKKYIIPDNDFDNQWDSLLSSFLEFVSAEANFGDGKRDLEDKIISFINDYDDKVVLNNIGDINGDSRFVYYWCRYILSLYENKNSLYDFVLGLCTANLMKNTLFYAKETSSQVSDLSFYLDTPMIFALLGMDSKERQDSYKYILHNAQKAGMKAFVFDHNIEEISGIIERASRWATSSQYDSAKANKVAEYFHDSGMEQVEIDEFISSIESTLNSMGIIVDHSAYLTEENSFQLDEQKLQEAIKAEYGRRALKYRTEEMFENSIAIDVRSIVMIERKRKAFYSTDFKNAKYVFISTNGVISKVAKDCYAEGELSKDKIPPCVTADIFGTILWFDFSDSNDQYCSLKLLADCKSLLKPTPLMIAQLNKQLDEAYKRRDISEDTFLFMRSHPIVRDKLLDATSGDYSSFTDQTWREVYERIESHAQFEGDRKYEEEKQRHKETIARHDEETKKWEEEMQSRDAIIGNKDDIIVKQRDKFSGIIAKMIAAVLIGIPYLAVVLLSIFLQNEFFNWTVKGIIIAIASLLAVAVFKFLFNAIEKKIKRIILRKMDEE